MAAVHGIVHPLADDVFAAPLTIRDGRFITASGWHSPRSEASGAVVPPLKVRDFNFTSLSDAV